MLPCYKKIWSPSTKGTGYSLALEMPHWGQGDREHSGVFPGGSVGMAAKSSRRTHCKVCLGREVCGQPLEGSSQVSTEASSSHKWQGALRSGMVTTAETPRDLLPTFLSKPLYQIPKLWLDRSKTGIYTLSITKEFSTYYKFIPLTIF